MPGHNPATRLLRFLESARQIPSNATMADGLKQLFGYEPEDVYREHARRCDALLVQVDLIEKGLQRREVPEVLYVNQLSQVRHAFSAGALAGKIDRLKSRVTTDDVLLAVRWAAFSLDDEGAMLDASELTSQLASLKQLHQEVVSSDLPAALRDFISDHLAQLIAALEIEPVSGVEPLQKAVKGLAADLVANADTLSSTSAISCRSQETGLLKTVGTRFRSVAEFSATVGNAAEGVEKVWKLVAERGPTLLKLGSDIVEAVTK